MPYIVIVSDKPPLGDCIHVPETARIDDIRILMEYAVGAHQQEKMKVQSWIDAFATAIDKNQFTSGYIQRI